MDSVKAGEDGHVRTVSIQYTNPGRNPQERSPMKVTTRPIHKIAVIVPVDYRFEDDQGPPATDQGRASREASPPAEVVRMQELPWSISWADEMEEEYELNGPPPDLEPGGISWAVQDQDNAPRETDASRRGQERAADASETAGTRPTEEAYLATRALGETWEDRSHSEAQGTATEGSYDRCSRSATDLPAPTKRPAGQEGGLGGAPQLRADRGSVSPRADLIVINS